MLVNTSTDGAHHMAAAVPVIRVIGPGRNIGKTWLASRLIAAFAARGYEVVKYRQVQRWLTQG